MKTKNKRNNKRRILILLLLMTVTAFTLVTSVFAWFTANKVVTVSEIQVNVEAQGGIQISADGTNWKSVIGIPDLTSVNSTTYTSSVNQIPSILKPVSTGKTVNTDGRMEMFLGTVTSNTDGDYILTATQSTEVEGTTGDFVAFDLFFRSDTATDLWLTTNSQVVTPDSTDTGIKNAARVGFVHLGNTAIGSPVATIQGLNAGVSSQVNIWEPNYDVHTAAGVAHARDTYGLTVTETGNASPLAYSGVFAPIAESDNVLVGAATGTTAFVKPVTPDYSTVAGFTTKTQIFSLQQGISKIRIYMWIEGQDVDCENSASGGNTIFNLQITNEL